MYLELEVELFPNVPHAKSTDFDEYTLVSSDFIKVSVQKLKPN